MAKTTNDGAAGEEKPAEPRVPVLMVFLYSDRKASRWLRVTEREIERSEIATQTARNQLGEGYGERVLSYKTKHGRGKHPGWVYAVEAGDEKAGTIYPGTTRLWGQWKNAADRAEWDVADKAERLERQAKADDPIAELIQPAVRLYRFANAARRAVIMHRVLKAFANA